MKKSGKSLAEISLLIIEYLAGKTSKNFKWLTQVCRILEKELDYTMVKFLEASAFRRPFHDSNLAPPYSNELKLAASAYQLYEECFQNHKETYFRKNCHKELRILFDRCHTETMVLFPILIHRKLIGGFFLFSSTECSIDNDERLIHHFILSRIKDSYSFTNYQQLSEKRSQTLYHTKTKIQKRFELAAVASETLLYDWDLKRKKVIRFKRGNNKIWGYTSNEFSQGVYWNKHIHPDDFSGVVEELKIKLKEKDQNIISCRYRFRKSDGTYAFVLDKGYIVRDSKGLAVRIVGSVNDITELVQKEQELEVANQRFSLAMKASNEMIYEWELEHTEIIRSVAFNKIFGDEKSSNSLKEWFSSIANEDRLRVKQSFFKALQDDNITFWKEEYSLIGKNSEIKCVIDRCYIIRNNGRVKKIVGAVLDITEHKRMLEEIKSKNQVLKDISWAQSHLVRAPIVRMKGVLVLLDDTKIDFWNDQELLKIFKDSIIELDEAIKNIAKKMEET